MRYLADSVRRTNRYVSAAYVCEDCGSVATYSGLTANNFKALAKNHELLNCPVCKLRSYDWTREVCMVSDLADLIFLSSAVKRNGEQVCIKIAK